jgi:hypothetical protein
MLMLPSFRSNQRSSFWRQIYLLCTFLVFSYVSFNLLDLDGSDFPLKRHSLERSVISAEVTEDTEHDYSVERPRLWPGPLMHSQAVPDEAVYIRLTRIRTFSSRDSTRAHGYRVALPRSSPPDSLELV